MNQERKGRVVAVCWSPVRDFPKYLQEKAFVGPHGIVGDAHAGPLRPSNSVPGTFKENDRAISIVAEEVRRELNETLGLKIEPGGFNENILVEGLGDLGNLKPGQSIIFEGGVVLLITEQNFPCQKLEDYNGKGIIKVASGKTEEGIFNKRGIVATVTKTGELHPGEEVFVK